MQPFLEKYLRILIGLKTEIPADNRRVFLFMCPEQELNKEQEVINWVHKMHGLITNSTKQPIDEEFIHHGNTLTFDSNQTC